MNLEKKLKRLFSVLAHAKIKKKCKIFLLKFLEWSVMNMFIVAYMFLNVQCYEQFMSLDQLEMKEEGGGGGCLWKFFM